MSFFVVFYQPLLLQDEMGEIVTTIYALRYNTVSGSMKERRGKSTMFVVTPLTKRERIVNSIYDAYCKNQVQSLSLYLLFSYNLL